jgi:hypothetical protein
MPYLKAACEEIQRNRKCLSTINCVKYYSSAVQSRSTVCHVEPICEVASGQEDCLETDVHSLSNGTVCNWAPWSALRTLGWYNSQSSVVLCQISHGSSHTSLQLLHWLMSTVHGWLTFMCVTFPFDHNWLLVCSVYNTIVLCIMINSTGSIVPHLRVAYILKN